MSEVCLTQTDQRNLHGDTECPEITQTESLVDEAVAYGPIPSELIDLNMRLPIEATMASIVRTCQSILDELVSTSSIVRP